MFDRYDPHLAPSPDVWTALDEMERIDRVVEHHVHEGVDMPSLHMHAALHVMIENQVAMGDKTPVAAALTRLIDEGLDRHDAIHALGTVAAEFIYDLQRGNLEGDAEARNAQYYQQISEMTAEKWLAMGDE